MTASAVIPCALTFEKYTMKEKLAIIVMGFPNSGKTATWISLFGRKVKTGKELRKLYLNSREYINVFLVSGSPEERGEYVGDLITQDDPEMVLCSMQFRSDSMTTINYFIDNGYSIYVQWINPGYQDQMDSMSYDTLGLTSYLLAKGAMLSIRNGKLPLESRVSEIRDHLYGWACGRNLLHPN